MQRPSIPDSTPPAPWPLLKGYRGVLYYAGTWALPLAYFAQYGAGAGWLEERNPLVRAAAFVAWLLLGVPIVGRFAATYTNGSLFTAEQYRKIWRAAALISVVSGAIIEGVSHSGLVPPAAPWSRGLAQAGWISVAAWRVCLPPLR